MDLPWKRSFFLRFTDESTTNSRLLNSAAFLSLAMTARYAFAPGSWELTTRTGYGSRSSI